MLPYKSMHFIGVLTPEMANLALWAVKQGMKVSGSDDHTDTVFLPKLISAGVTFFDMFAQTNITPHMEAVVLSRYYEPRHQEATTAEKYQIPVINENELLHTLTDAKQKLAVIGNYEAPIIATWLAETWKQGHMPVDGLSDAFLENKTEKLPYEADEWVIPFCGFKRDAGTYEADFLSFEAQKVIIPGILYDYPELYMTLDDVYNAYYTFVKRVPRKGLIIGNNDYSRMKRLRMSLADRSIVTYGFDRDSVWQIREVSVTNGKTSFSLAHDRQMYGPFMIPYVGTLYVYAATAVVVASLLQDMKIDVVARGLENLPKLRRYFEMKQDREHRLIIDDRADHPAYIQHVLETIKEQFPEKKIWCLYQPGSFLRTRAMNSELQSALALADFVYLTDIQGYPREKSEGLNIRHIIAEMRQKHPQTYYFDDSMNMSGLLADRVASTDCIVTLGVEGLCQQIVHPLFPKEEE